MFATAAAAAAADNDDDAAADDDNAKSERVFAKFVHSAAAVEILSSRRTHRVTHRRTDEPPRDRRSQRHTCKHTSNPNNEGSRRFYVSSLDAQNSATPIWSPRNHSNFGGRKIANKAVAQGFARRVASVRVPGTFSLESL